MAPDDLSVRVEHEIIKTFRKAGAKSGTTARKLRELGLVGNPVLKGLVDRNVIRRAGPERYFLDETAWQSEKGMSNTSFVRVAIAIIAIGAGLVVFLSTR